MAEQVRGYPRVHVLHAAPNAPTMDIYVDGSPAVSGLSFAEVSDYVQFSPGAHEAQVYPANMAGNPLLSAGLDLARERDYTLVVVGTLSSLNAVLLLDSTPAPTRGQAKVRAFHASPDAPPLDVVVSGRQAPLFSGLAFQQSTPWSELAARMVDLDLRPSGSTEPLLSLPDLVLDGGALYTFTILGLVNGQPGIFVMPIVEAVAAVSPLGEWG